MELRKVEAVSLRAQIYDQLREKIMSGEIKPGEDLSLRSLAEKLGVSLMPVREAIWQLQSDRILVVRNNRGIRVNTLTPEELHEALHLRVLLETEALVKSIQNCTSAVTVEVLEDLMLQMESSACNARTFLELNRQFHFSLYSYAKSPLLFDLLEKLWGRITPYVYLTITKNEDLAISPANKYHRDLLECFVARDIDNAIKVLKEDIENPAIRIIGGYGSI